MWKKLFVVPQKEGKIYILPTAHGVAILITVIIMIGVGATFNNNLVNTLAFLLFSILTVSMVQTYVNLKGLAMEMLSCADAFSGEKVRLRFSCANRSGRFRHNFWVEVKKWDQRVRVDGLGPGETQILSLYWVTESRGLHKVPSLTLFTRYPLGLFRAWTSCVPGAEYYVYPKPEGTRPLPLRQVGGASHIGDQGRQKKNGAEDFREHRLYRQGDLHRRIDWRASARHDKWLVRIYEEEPAGWIELSLDDIKGEDLEARLSQMSAWIRMAEVKHVGLQVRFPGGLPMEAVDSSSRRSVLQRLAVFGREAA